LQKTPHIEKVDNKKKNWSIPRTPPPKTREKKLEKNRKGGREHGREYKEIAVRHLGKPLHQQPKKRKGGDWPSGGKKTGMKKGEQNELKPTQTQKKKEWKEKED